MEFALRPTSTMVQPAIDGTFQKQTFLTQPQILEEIESVGKTLRELPTGSDSAGLVDVFKRYIDAVNQAPDRDHTSGLFGKGTTNREENLYLLMTTVDSANVTDEAKTYLLGLLNEELEKSRGADSYFNKVAEIEKGIQSPVVEGKSSLLFAPNRTGTLRIEGQKFNIENTPRERKVGRLASDFLPYPPQNAVAWDSDNEI